MHSVKQAKGALKMSSYTILTLPHDTKLGNPTPFIPPQQNWLYWFSNKHLQPAWLKNEIHFQDCWICFNEGQFLPKV